MDKFEKVKEIIKDIEVLKEKIEELDSISGSDLLSNLRVIPDGVSVGSNTMVILEQAGDKMLEEFKHLLTSEVGDRMKQLNLK